MSEIPTPLTDREAFRYDLESEQFVVDAAFARALERQLSAYKQVAATREGYDKSHSTLACENHNLKLDKEELIAALKMWAAPYVGVTIGGYTDEYMKKIKTTLSVITKMEGSASTLASEPKAP